MARQGEWRRIPITAEPFNLAAHRIRTAPLLDIATGALTGADISAAWTRWRGMRPDLDDVSAAEMAVLPMAWGRAELAGTIDPDAARLAGIRRKAALTTAVTLARVVSAQDALRDAGVPSAVGGEASVVLLGAASAAERSIRRADLWVARSASAVAREVLLEAMRCWRTALRQAVTGSSTLSAWPGVVLRWRLPSVPPIDASALVCARQRISWAGAGVDALGPTEAVFAADVVHAAQSVAARTRQLTRGTDAHRGAAAIGRNLDRRLIRRLDGFDAGHLERLHRYAGWGALEA